MPNEIHAALLCSVSACQSRSWPVACFHSFQMCTFPHVSVVCTCILFMLDLLTFSSVCRLSHCAFPASLGQLYFGSSGYLSLEEKLLCDHLTHISCSLVRAASAHSLSFAKRQLLLDRQPFHANGNRAKPDTDSLRISSS